MVKGLQVEQKARQFMAHFSARKQKNRIVSPQPGSEFSTCCTKFS